MYILYISYIELQRISHHRSIKYRKREQKVIKCEIHKDRTLFLRKILFENSFDANTSFENISPNVVDYVVFFHTKFNNLHVVSLKFTTSIMTATEASKIHHYKACLLGLWNMLHGSSLNMEHQFSNEELFSITPEHVHCHSPPHVIMYGCQRASRRSLMGPQKA